MILHHGILVRPAIRHINRTHSDIVVCVLENTFGDYWKCMVVKGNDTYKVGDWNLSIHADDIRAGIPCVAVDKETDDEV